MIDETSIIGKANMGTSKFGTRLYIPKIRLVFAKLK